MLSPSDVPEPFKAGVAFDTVSVNPAEYLPWLQSELTSCGVTFERRNVRSLDELKSLVGPDGILVNASSLGKEFPLEVALVTPAQRVEIHYRSGRHETIPHSRTNDSGTCARFAGVFTCRFRCAFGMSSGHQLLTKAPESRDRGSYIHHSPSWKRSTWHCNPWWDIPAEELGHLFRYADCERNIRSLRCIGSLFEECRVENPEA